MSVLIKGMEMPTSCRACPLATRFFDGEDVCAMLGTYVHDRDREDDCPLVPVPPNVINFDKPYSFTISWDGEQLKGNIIGTAI